MSLKGGCVVECRICNPEVAGSKLGRGLLRTKVYSAIHPPGVGKWVPAIAGKAKAGMAHSDCAWTCGCAGNTVKSLENTCHIWALLRWWFTTKRRYIKCMHLYLYLRSLKVLPFDRLFMVSYYYSIVTLSVRCTVFEIFDYKNAVTLKTGLRIREGHWKCHHSIKSLWRPIDFL